MFESKLNIFYTQKSVGEKYFDYVLKKNEK